ncbi:cadherin-related family member 5 [Pseudophryne corroboree]|uniref:cadherin-related family member 5 n=1 Tax=Pseudophryne corroboree TaxID=495146 RepID=UPI0030812C65
MVRLTHNLSNDNVQLLNAHLNEGVVCDRLKNEINKTPGLDGIHQRFLMELHSELERPLYLIFNDSLTTGMVSKDWRTAEVVLILKKGTCTAREQFISVEENNPIGYKVTELIVAPDHTVDVESDYFAVDGFDLILTVSVDYEVPSQTVFVTIINSNDNEPIFPKTSYEFTISEHYFEIKYPFFPKDLPVGSSIAVITATDADKDILYYELSGNDTNAAAYFRLSSNTDPVILVNKALDYDQYPIVNMHLTVRDTANAGDSPSHTATAAITVVINDVDDKLPFFQPCIPTQPKICISTGYRSSVNRTEQATEPLDLLPSPLYAVDGDYGINIPINYSLVSGYIVSTGNIGDVLQQLFNGGYAPEQREEAKAIAGLVTAPEKDSIDLSQVSTFLSVASFNDDADGRFFQGVSALYSNPRAAVLANGVMSLSFQIANGMRQGCPLSPLIFALSIEPLAARIRANPYIKGVKIRHFHSTLLTQLNHRSLTTLEDLAMRKDSTRGLISTIHRSLVPPSQSDKEPHERAWELDFGEMLDCDEWSDIYSSLVSSSICVRAKENAYKLFYRWYYIPTRLAKMYPELSPLCWRCVETTMDDIIVWGSTKEEHDSRLRQVIELVKKLNIHSKNCCISCPKGDSQDVFAVQDNGNITMNKAIDTLGTILLQVMAYQTDNILRYSITTVQIEVKEKNIFPPTFEHPIYHGNVASDSAIKSFVADSSDQSGPLQVFAADRDYLDLINPAIMYKIENSTDFSILRDGYILTNTLFTSSGNITLQVTATDSATAETDSTIVIVEITATTTTAPTTTSTTTRAGTTTRNISWTGSPTSTGPTANATPLSTTTRTGPTTTTTPNTQTTTSTTTGTGTTTSTTPRTGSSTTRNPGADITTTTSTSGRGTATGTTTAVTGTTKSNIPGTMTTAHNPPSINTNTYSTIRTSPTLGTGITNHVTPEKNTTLSNTIATNNPHTTAPGVGGISTGASTSYSGSTLKCSTTTAPTTSSKTTRAGTTTGKISWTGSPTSTTSRTGPTANATPLSTTSRTGPTTTTSHNIQTTTSTTTGTGTTTSTTPRTGPTENATPLSTTTRTGPTTTTTPNTQTTTSTTTGTGTTTSTTPRTGSSTTRNPGADITTTTSTSGRGTATGTTTAVTGTTKSNIPGTMTTAHNPPGINTNTYSTIRTSPTLGTGITNHVTPEKTTTLSNTIATNNPHTTAPGVGGISTGASTSHSANTNGALQADIYYTVNDMAALGASLGVILVLCFIGLGFLINKHYGNSIRIRLRRNDGDNFGDSNDSTGFINEGDSSNTPIPTNLDYDFGGINEKEPISSNMFLDTAAVIPVLSNNTANSPPTGTEENESDSDSTRVKPILTKEFKEDVGYKSVWFREDAAPEVVVIERAEEGEEEEDDEEFNNQQANDDNDEEEDDQELVPSFNFMTNDSVSFSVL